MSIYCNYAPYGTKIVVLAYVDDCVYWYTSESIGKWFVDDIEKILRVKFLGYANWFMSIIIYQIKGQYISVDQARYDTSVVEKYLDITTVKASTNIYNTTLPYDIIFAKADAYTSDDKV